jgi:hypothetical protein
VNREDELFCAWKHEIPASGGFVIEADWATGVAASQHSSRWDARYGCSTTAMIGMMCVSRFENSGKIGYRDLITSVAVGLVMPFDFGDAMHKVTRCKFTGPASECGCTRFRGSRSRASQLHFAVVLAWQGMS